MRKFLKIAGKVLAVIFVTMFLIATALQIGIFAGVRWLNAPQGQDFVRQKIDQALSESGYQLNYSKISYALSGIGVRDLELRDAQGVAATADYAEIGIDILSLAVRQVSFSLHADHVILDHLPQGTAKPEQPKQGLKPFALPDIYFTSIELNDLAIDRLDIKENVAGQAMSLSPKIYAEIDFEGKIKYEIEAEIEQKADRKIEWLPGSIETEGQFDPSQLRLDLAELNIANKIYQIFSTGYVELGENGNIQMTANAESSDLLPLAGQGGSFDLKASLSGKTELPDINLSGRATLDALTQKGVGEITLAAKSQTDAGQAAGDLEIHTSYKDLPLSLASEFSYQSPQLQLSDINLRGPDLDANGEITLQTDTRLAAGDIHLIADNLKTYADLFDLDAQGKLEVDLSLSPGKSGTQAALVRLNLNDGRYQTYRLAKLDLDAYFENVLNPWPDNLDLSLRSARLGNRLNIDRFDAQLNKNGDEDYRLSLTGKGRLPQAFSLNGKAGLSGLAGGAPAAEDIDLIFSTKGSRLQLTGMIDQEKSNLKLATDNLSLQSLPVAVPAALQGTTISGKVALNGPLAAPQIQADIASNMLQIGKSGPSLKLFLDADYKDDLLDMSLRGTGQGVRELSGDVELPLHFALQPFAFDLSPETALDGKVAFDLNGGTLANALLPPDHLFSGDLNGNVNLAGTVGAPDIGGYIKLQNGSYIYSPYEVVIRDILLQANLADKQILLTRLSANDGQSGTLEGSGKIALDNPADTRVDIAATGFHLVRSEQADGTLGADLQITGMDNGYRIGGDINAGEFDVIIPEQFRTNIPQLNIVKPETEESEALKIIALNIDIHAPRRIFVRGWGLDAEFGGNLDLTGTLNKPLVNGNLDSIRGRYEEFGKRFDLKKANLRFQGSVPPSPYLDIEATTNADEITASVLLTGSVQKPSIAFSSVPSLPQDEILSHILFGESMDKITPFQAVQLAQTLQRFSGNGGGGFDPLGRLRSVTGVDDISINTDESGENSVGVGKYLTDKVYIEVEKGQGEASGAANIEVEVTPSISIESEIGQDSQGGAGIFWSRDY